MTFFSVLAKKEFVDESGEIQKRWYPIGTVKETERGGRYLTLNINPNTTYIIVPNEEREPVIQLDEE